MSYTLCKLLQEKLSDYVIFENLTELNYLLKDNKKFDIIDKLPDSTTKSSYTSRHHDIECSVAIKKSLKPKRIIIDPLGGNLTYSNSLMIIEFDNLVIFNCYLQAGTKFSPGQDKLYLNYSRCREQLVEYVIEKVKAYNNIPIVILGDFNIDLNDDGTNFPEINIITELKRELGFVKAVPLCFTLPGQSSTILLNIKNNGFDFSQINYEIDRYIIDSVTGYGNDKYLAFNNDRTAII
jgi:hypothetical protein